MARISQFAKDMGMSYNQAKNLVNKGRKLSDGGSSVLEKVKMTSKKDKDKDKKKEKFDPNEFIVKPFFEIPEGMEEEFAPARGRSVRPEKKKDGGLGMQSVKYGLDNNPAITAADPKAKFIAANKKAAGGMPKMPKYRDGGQFRGCGAQLSGKKFKGIF